MTLSVQGGIYRLYPKHLIGVLILVLFLHSAFSSGDANASAKKVPFRPGEKLTYRIKWGVIPAGELSLEVFPRENINGTEAYHFVMITKTNEVLDLLYKVRERQDSYVDIGMTHSILYKKRSEGEHPRDVVVNFDWEKLEATRSNFGKKMDPVHISPGSFDPLALFFVIRFYDIKENSVFEIPITEGDNNVAAKATVVKRETIEIEGRMYDTFEIIPDMERLKREGVVKEGDSPQLTIWFSADDKKIPLKIKSKVKVGYFIFELVSIEP